MKDKEKKKIVKEKYSKIAKDDCGCSLSCCSKSKEDISKSIGYSKKDLESTPEANMGLGCGNPVALSDIQNGDTVLDLGSGAGFDAFLARKRVGKDGKVIGVDMTESMIEKAKKIKEKYNYENVEFKLGDIEDLPIKDSSVDIIMSNCVINLAPNKQKVFKEAYRVLKDNGKMYVSDIVLLKELTKKQKNDKDLLSGCVAGALLKYDYIDIVKNTGFKVEILGEDRDISKRQYNGINLESLKIKAKKPK